MRDEPTAVISSGFRILLVAPDQKKTNIDVNDTVAGSEQVTDVGEESSEVNPDLEENVFTSTSASLLQELPQTYMIPTSGINIKTST